MEIMLSIIIPHYNTPDLLIRLLDSIMPEKEDTMEIIVVDDHSTTINEVEEIKNNYRHVRFYSNHPQKKDAGSCRNIGLEKARGKWLIFADADDIFLPGWGRIVSEYYDQPYDIVWFVPMGKGIGGKEFRKKPVRLVKEYIKDPSKSNENRLRYNYYVPWSKLIRRSIVEKGNILFDELPYGNDAFFSVRCGAAAKLVYADNRSIYCSIEYSNSLISVRNSEVYKNRNETMCRCYAYARKQIGSCKAKELDNATLIYTRLSYIINHHYGIKCFLDHVIMFIKYRIPLSPSIRYAFNKFKTSKMRTERYVSDD